MARVLIPLPSLDFDPTEAAVSHQILQAAGHDVRFATPDGAPAQADELMLSGEELDPWGRHPTLRRFPLLGLALRADGAARRAYRRMEQDPWFRAPMRWDQLRIKDLDALLIPGGHRARGMRPFLESPLLQGLIAEAFGQRLPVAAVCHGVLLVARSRRGGRSVLHGLRTTALPWSFEHTAWRLARVARFWDPGYYRTYKEAPEEPAGYWSVQAEVTRSLASEEDFQDLSPLDPGCFRKGSGLFRDTVRDDRPAFVVQDGVYVSARWPGDVHTFAHRLAGVLRGR
jgi:putative intracellular protease/amidase